MVPSRPPPNKQKKQVFNPFEQVVEFGKKMATGVGTDLLNTFNPAGPVELGNSDTDQHEQMKNIEQKKDNKNHTPLDFNKLGKSYQEKDSQSLDALRQKYFNRVKGEDEKLFQEGKQKIEQAKQMDQQDKWNKENKMKQNAQAQPAESHGKQKGRLGVARKKASVDTNFEAKYAKGK